MASYQAIVEGLLLDTGASRAMLQLAVPGGGYACAAEAVTHGAQQLAFVADGHQGGGFGEGSCDHRGGLGLYPVGKAPEFATASLYGDFQRFDCNPDARTDSGVFACLVGYNTFDLAATRRDQRTENPLSLRRATANSATVPRKRNIRIE